MTAIDPPRHANLEVRSAAAAILGRLIDRQQLRDANHAASAWRTDVRAQWCSLGYDTPFSTWDDSASALAHLAPVAELSGRTVAPFATSWDLCVDLILAEVERSGGPARGALDVSGGVALAGPYLASDATRWGPSLRADVKPDAVQVTGHLPYVIGAGDAGTLLAHVTTDDGCGFVLVPMNDCAIVGLETIDVSLEACSVDVDVQLEPEALLSACSVAFERRCLAVHSYAQLCELVGVGRQAFDEACDYIRERFAFGRAVASFQAIKHRCADLEKALLECEGCLLAVGQQLRDEGDLTWGHLFAVHHVKRSIPDLVQECIQLHGGIGMTWECDVHLFLRRATLLAAVGITADDAYDLWCANEHTLEQEDG